MRQIFILLILGLGAFSIRAEEVSAIIEKSEAVLTIKAVDKAEFEFRKTVTVYSENGRSHAQLVYYEDGFRKTTFYKVKITDRQGRIVAKYDENDFKRSAVIGSVSSYGEVERYRLDCGPTRYPYTMEIHAKMRWKAFFHLDFSFVNEPHTVVQNSKLEVVHPVDYELEYYLNRPESVEVAAVDGKKRDTLKFELDSYTPEAREQFTTQVGPPKVLIVPSEFAYGGMVGSLESWREFGLWMSRLWEGRDQLPESVTAQLDALIAAADNKEECARDIYSFVQNNMRYVSITYGLGGLQTMSADETYNLGYGDCKALTNFTAAAMRYAGIEAYPALVYAGESHPELDAARPMNGFNHVILCLPQLGDTTWLECTSTTAPFGYIANFTDDRDALLLTPEGGKLTRTHSYSPSMNEAIRNTLIELSSDGSASVSLHCEYRYLAMLQTAFYRREVLSEPPLAAVKSEVNLASFDLEKFDSQLFKDQEPLLEVFSSLDARLVGRKIGNRMMIRPFMMETSIPKLESDLKRESPIYFKHGYVYVDTIRIVFPAGMSLSDSLRNFEDSGPYGRVSLTWNVDENQREIRVVRNIRLNDGEFPAEKYGAVAGFLQKVRDTQEAFVILE